MKTNAGMWIDHREAIIVVLSESEEGDVTKRILSAVEKKHAQEMPADDSRQREFTEHLARYYDAIISYLQEARSILIFGPGEAKGELKKRFEARKDEARTIEVETTDNMTEHQVAARVREHFRQESRRGA